MIVMKFGGTSVEDAASVKRVAEIVRARIDQKPLVVVSAMGKTTRKLLESAEASASGDTRTTLAAIASLKTRHLSEARRLVKSNAGRLVFEQIEAYFEELKKLLEGLAILGEVPPRGLDKILAYGELLSSSIVAGALTEAGISARLMDSRELIKTDDRFGSASPLFALTNKTVDEAITPVIEKNEVPLVQGFIGSTREGATTTLGFEGSDYTATIIGAALNAADIQIWKDVSGLMTADPNVCDAARTVKICSYREAADLTFFGAKVLHPKAIHPAAERNIPVHIYNSRQPDATGTSIAATAPRSSTPIKSIAYKRPVTIISIRPDSSEGAASAGPTNDFFRTILLSLNRKRITPLITTLSSSSIAVALDARTTSESAERDLVEDLRRFATVETERGRAIISLVGEELPADRQLAGRVFTAIGNIEIRSILQGSSPLTLSFVVSETDVEKVIARLHDVIFKKPDPKIFE
ncbi:MAG TPA: aspartate kinase [Blastocatellia bacterium]|nr:aspartate kinase [Blastocatellia bacterium]